MSEVEEIEETVDEFVDELDPLHVLSEARRHGITVDELLARVVIETKARLEV